MQQLSKLTSKFQATIPLAIRRKLGLKPGDAVVFEIENDVITVRRATALDREYAKSLEGTLTEWLSKEDEEAYRGL
ncbi:MAG: AbrB/MazE/SpoVT family DNA-binding domain-containing protein [Sulfuricaulis sp.]|jgi:AbrB family looped-hinge helix DNA binding protein|uniref:AbrB/MazE/SpoVT family DNA-binding domain-containing protein n=1 Tax=Sulfuricaulis sp. TaxID=2003553 RepID=UPI003C4B4716